MKKARISSPHFHQYKEGENGNDEEVEFESLLEASIKDPHSKEESQDNSIEPVLKTSTKVPQSKEGTIQTSHQEPSAKTTQTSDPTHILTELIFEVNLRWCVEGLWMLYERDNFVTEIGHPKRTIYKER